MYNGSLPILNPIVVKPCGIYWLDIRCIFSLLSFPTATTRVQALASVLSRSLSQAPEAISRSSPFLRSPLCCHSENKTDPVTPKLYLKLFNNVPLLPGKNVPILTQPCRPPSSVQQRRLQPLERWLVEMKCAVIVKYTPEFEDFKHKKVCKLSH